MMHPMNADRPPSHEDLDRVEGVIARWAATQEAENPAVVAAERGEPGQRRWYLRLRGESRDVFTVWLTVRQRTLRHETYFMPPPATNAQRLYGHLLVRNHALRSMRFSIGDEDAVFVVGEIAVDGVDEASLDQMLGGVYEVVEQNFTAAMRIGYEGSFRS
jgi:hypothetical protein